MRRIYRDTFKLDGFTSWETTVKETNLFIKACKDLRFEVFELVKKVRNQLETYINKKKDFLTSLEPVEEDKKAPNIVKRMIAASKKAGVGPMAAVAGAIAEEVGRYLLKECDECVVENGGDVFLKLKSNPTVGIYTENPYFRDKLTIKLPAFDKPIGICSSSAKIGPSLSFGKADLATIVDFDVAFADALATRTANIIKTEDGIKDAIELAKQNRVIGCLFIKGKKIGLWGNIELI